MSEVKVTYLDQDGVWTSVEIDPEKATEQAAHIYKAIQDTIDRLTAERAKLEAPLIKARVETFFPEDRTKLFYQPGRSKNQLNEAAIRSELTYEEYLKVSRVVEKELIKLTRPTDNEFGERLVEANKKTVGQGKPSLRYGPMTEDDMKRWRKLRDSKKSTSS